MTLNRFYIGRYEVTVGQIRAFANAGGKVDADALKGTPDLPVVNVNWHEALAYAQWLDARLRQTPAVPAAVRDMLSPVGGQSCRVTLPSEAEWEKAARGTDGRIYPWGKHVRLEQAELLGIWQRRTDTGRFVSCGSQPLWPAGHERQRVGVDAKPMGRKR